MDEQKANERTMERTVTKTEQSTSEWEIPWSKAPYGRGDVVETLFFKCILQS